MNELCVHCKRIIVFELYIKGEWSHLSGSTYCLDRRGVAPATPYRKAMPCYHPSEAVL